MANQEQLKILKQGVKEWNQWRNIHPDEKIDLRDVNLVGEDLRGADLEEVDLKRANLKEADLRGVNLKEADLRKADLIGANLINAKLTDANLIAANLAEAKLTKTKLSGANLTVVTLTRADLTMANLGWTRLVETNLSESTITGVRLYGTARDGWKIDRIRCDYVYWDAKRYRMGKEGEKQWELEHRFPKDRNFRPGEFEELYKHLPTFEYAFEHGITLIDIGIIDQIVNDIAELHPDWELQIDSFHSRGQPHANFTIREKDLIAQAFQQIKTNYEATLNRLKGQYEESNLLLARFMKELTNRPQLVLTGDIIVGDKNIGRDHIEISGQAQVDHLTTGDSGNATSGSRE